jgi:glycosyltransferase involved in cell wall biosynthesis
LQSVVAEWGARAFVISDVPVRFVEGRAPAACSGPRVVVINTFSVDEPVAEVLAAARALPEVCFFVTGDTRYADPALLASAGPNVTFTGFVSEEEYAGLLRASDVVTVLTTHDHTMQRGGYEAVALDKPLVTSDWGLLRETFSRGTIHVANAPAAIADGIRTAVQDRSRLAAEMKSLRDERRQLFDERLAALLAAVGDCRTSEETPRPGKVGDRQWEGSR